MNFCAPGSFRNTAPDVGAEGDAQPGSSPQHVIQESVEVKTLRTSSSSKNLARRHQPGQWLPLAVDGSKYDVGKQRRAPIMMPSVATPPDFACFGRSLG